MQLETVSIEDVFPVEDTYGNQYLSRDYSLKANQDYVRDLAASFGPDGQPDEPPVLVRDGGIFRIKSGNSRIMAMREIGTKSFRAIIDERDTPKSLVEAAIRTDTKKTYEPIERSRYEQQLFLFGPDEYVAEVTGRSVEHVKKARRIREAVEDAADDMTIERMIALADFEDDTEAYQKIVNASESEWRRLVDDLARERQRKQTRAAIIAALEARGVTEIEDSTGMKYLGAIPIASSIPEDIPEDACYRLDKYYVGAYIYAPASNAEEEEQSEKVRVRDELKALWEKANESREAWIVEHINDVLPHIRALTDESPYSYSVNSFLKENDIRLPETPASTILAYALYSIKPFTSSEIDDDAEVFVALTDAMRADGYEPPEEEMRLYEMCQEYMAGGGNDE